MGDLKFVVPKPEETFGNLAYAGKGEERAVRGNRGGLRRVTERTYALYSDRQRADSIEVTIPASAGEKHFAYEEPVKLVNPKITQESYSIGDRGYTRYRMTAEDLIKASEDKQEKERN